MNKLKEINDWLGDNMWLPNTISLLAIAISISVIIFK